MNYSYFNQFNISKLFYIKLRETILSFRNLSLILILIIIIITIIQHRNRILIRRNTIINKILYTIAYTLTKEHLNIKHKTFLPFIFNLLIFLTRINLIGLLPYVLTTTAHIIITFSLSLTILIRRTIKRIQNFKRKFIRILTPQGAPLILAPFLVLIETASYLTRAISLGVRLAANISAGHLLLTILSRFSFNILLSELPALSFIPLTILTFIAILEIAVALIQAYVFTLLSTIYLSDRIKIH
uniref:ATP synthase subunit a n=1 Tax=Aphrocallistes vastus TaxID=83887 RepID=B2BRP3_APHVA|nr:ATP synthase F0 subunit 6 [Aphrocallistes vastus]ABR58837.1 ATP synthase F0 subunit 6 [Aphrocallistes vastus]